ncbi:hypothetical protein FB565_004621 [Actinoplanes lutulentus]|uniref:Uncharacterized protein n=1 Tax=Actinoplanes lutulentus TaxID=1287878 RepID=A0A327Z8P9_9ACTN|nr:hypothetical protein [Actinoplanes lutulentus]MBB2944888.1 hypothetical protein [Actinoplanes lutulentus]RAK35322.1 hypothetical protein B0I29_11074 [Actinoplanes lutulentus]
MSRPEEPQDFPTVPGLPEVPADAEEPCEEDDDEPSRRSAVAERPYNIRPARILEQSYPERGLNMNRLFSQSRSDDTQPRSDESRMMNNRPYRGAHRAEYTQQAAEISAAWQRSTRVGKHHSGPAEDHYINQR